MKHLSYYCIAIQEFIKRILNFVSVRKSFKTPLLLILNKLKEANMTATALIGNSKNKEATNENFSLPLHWEKVEHSYTSDNVIDAYFKGREDERDIQKKIISIKFRSNMDIAATLAEELYKKAASHGIELKNIHLKADSTTKFEALFIADENDYVSDKFREIFIIARDLKNKAESDSFYISFSFVPNSAHLNEECIIADGFIFKYKYDQG